MNLSSKVKGKKIQCIPNKLCPNPKKKAESKVLLTHGDRDSSLKNI